MDSPSKSRATTTSKERERTDRQRTSPLFFLRTEGTGLRSGQLFRCASCGTAQLAGFGVVRHRKVGSLLASRSSSPSSSPLQPDRAGRRQHRHDQSERSSDEDEKSLLLRGGGRRKGSWGDVGEARRAAGRTVESSKNEFLACRTVCSFEFLVHC